MIPLPPRPSVLKVVSELMVANALVRFNKQMVDNLNNAEEFTLADFNEIIRFRRRKILTSGFATSSRYLSVAKIDSHTR